LSSAKIIFENQTFFSSFIITDVLPRFYDLQCMYFFYHLHFPDEHTFTGYLLVLLFHLLGRELLEISGQQHWSPVTNWQNSAAIT